MVYNFHFLLVTYFFSFLFGGSAIYWALAPSPWKQVLEDVERYSSDETLVVLAKENWRYRLSDFSGYRAIATAEFIPEMSNYPRIFVISSDSSSHDFESLGEILWSGEHDPFFVSLLQLPANSETPLNAFQVSEFVESCAQTGSTDCPIQFDSSSTTCVSLESSELILPYGASYAGWFEATNLATQWQGERIWPDPAFFIFPERTSTQTIQIIGSGCLRLHVFPSIPSIESEQ